MRETPLVPNRSGPVPYPIGSLQGLTLYVGQALQWVDGEQIGRLLYPEAEDPANNVNHVYNRSRRQFAEGDTLLVEMPNPYQWTPGTSGDAVSPDVPPKTALQCRHLRFFSLPQGLLKLCVLSRSPHALSILERTLALWKAALQGKLPLPDPSLATLTRMPRWTHGVGKLRAQVAAEYGVSQATIRRYEKKLLAGKPFRPSCYEKRRFCRKKYRDLKPLALRLMAEGQTVEQVRQQTGVTRATIYAWRKAMRSLAPGGRGWGEGT